MTARRSSAKPGAEAPEGAQPAKPPARGQARRHGVLACLLSWLGGVLTILTVAAALALVAAAPRELPPSLDELAPAAGSAAAPSPSSVLGGLAGVAGLLLRPELGWLRALAADVVPRGLTLRDMRVVLDDTPLGRPLPIHIARLTATPRAGGWTATVDGHLDDPEANRFSAVATLAETGHVVVHGRLDAAALGLARDDVEISGGTVNVQLTTRLVDGAVDAPIDVVLRSAGPLAVRAAGMVAALPIESLEAALRVTRADVRVRIERTALISPAFRAAIQGHVGAEAVDLRIGIDEVDATWAERLWPEGLADGARDWVTENIPKGRIDRLDMRVALDPRRLAEGTLPHDAIRGEARVSGAEIHYRRPMPPVVEASATARFDANRLAFSITGGRLAAIAVEGGDVVIRDYAASESVERLEVDVRGEGAVPDILAVTDHEPLQLASRYGLPIEASAGSGSFRVQVELPLLRDLALEAVDLRFSGTFTEVDLPGMAAGRDLTGATVRLDATPDVVEASGEGRIAGVPLDFGYRLDGPADVERLRASGRVEAERLEALGLPAALPARGPVELDAVIDIGETSERTRVTLGLADTEVDLASLGIWKPAGIDGRLEATLAEGAATIELEEASVRWPGVDVVATGTFAADGTLRLLSVDPLHVAGTRLRLLAERADGRIAASISGERLDVEPLLAGLSGAPEERGEARAPWPTTRVDLAIDEVVGGTDARLLDLRGHLETDADGFRVARLDGRTEASEAALRLRLEPNGVAGQSLRLVSDDAGGLLRSLGLADTLQAGRLVVQARVTQQRPFVHAEGDLEATDFVLAGTPAVIRLIAATPQSLDVEPDHLRVDTFTTPFALDGETLHVEDAFLRASSLAMRATGDLELASGVLDIQGSLAPLAALNRFIGRLPVLGALLQGSKEAGAFAVNFTISGPRADPRVTVNPLSVVTPGLLQDLFEGADMKPPQIRQD